MEHGQYKATTKPDTLSQEKTPRQSDESQVDPGAAATRPVPTNSMEDVMMRTFEMSGKTYVTIGRSDDWQHADWSELCRLIGAQITPQRLDNLRNTAAAFLGGNKHCDFLQYSLDPDGTVKQENRVYSRFAELGDTEA